MKRYVVIGLGNFGSAVAETLYGAGNEVAALDLDASRVEGMANRVTRVAVGDGTDSRSLRRLGAEDADAAIVSTGGDVTASAMAALVLRDVGVPDVFVKVMSGDHARLIEKIGVTETIFPERESGLRLGRRLSNGALLNFVPLGAGFSVQEMAVPNGWVGHTLRDLQLRRRLGVTVVAVHDILQGKMHNLPDPDAPLKESDTLLVAGSDDDLAKAASVG